jgi:predicted SAM-dependent methyltransferase
LTNPVMDPELQHHAPLTDGPRLNVGCGSTVAATWINLDNSPTMWLAQRPLLWGLARRLRLVPADMAETPTYARQVTLADVRRRLPFPTGSVAAVYSSHFLEHLSREDAARFLGEARRVLQPGGVIRTVVPDLARVVELYRQERAGGDPHAGDHFFDNLWVIDKMLDRYPAWFRPLKSFLRTDVHKWLYDEASLTALLQEEGFVEIRRCAYLESAIAGIEAVEREGRVVESLCLEARRSVPAPLRGSARSANAGRDR